MPKLPSKEKEEELDKEFLDMFINPEETPIQTTNRDDVLGFIDWLSDQPQPVHLKDFPRLSDKSSFVMEGSLAILAGEPGSCKSYFALSIGLNCTAQKIKWAYMPLESKREFHLKRLACMLNRNWDAAATKQTHPNNHAQVAQTAAVRVADVLEVLTPCIFNNPYLNSNGRAGQKVNPEFVMKWLKMQFELGVKVAIIDPWSAISFSGKNLWESEANFSVELTNLAKENDACVIMVCHTIKKTESKLPSQSDIQGSATLTRLSDAVLIMQKHMSNGNPTVVFRSHGEIAEIEHNRIINIVKARNSIGDGLRFAYNFGENGATFDELGIISPN